MRAELERLLPQGQGWQACEVDNLGHDPGRWPAALVRPGAVVQAWLDEAAPSGRLFTRWNASVARLLHLNADRHDQSALWQAQDAQGQVLAQASCVVVAGAMGSLPLLVDEPPGGLKPQALPLRPVRGQMSLGEQEGPALAERPQRNNGVFVPLYEDSGLPPAWPRRIWAMGSTYSRGDNSTQLSDTDHQQNLHSLQSLNPAAAVLMQAQTEQNQLLGWAQVRCASLDRLPLVGALPDLAALQRSMAQAGSRRSRLTLAGSPRVSGLFMLSALGSRGLTLAHWCAEQLAAQMNGETPAAQHTDLLQALDPARFAWRQARKQGANPSE